MPAGEVVCSEQLVTGDDENTQIRPKYKYKHTQKDKKWPKSCFGSDIASQQGFGEKIRVKRVLTKKLKFGRVLDFTAGFGFYCRFWILLPILDFTADFGLKVRQVSAGFGCREGYYP